MNKKIKHIVMFGCDDTGKARACRFDASQEIAVRKAGSQMRYRVGIPKTGQADAVAAKLTEGKFLDSGLVTVAAVTDDIFYKLAKLMTFDSNWTTAGIITGKPSNTDGAVLKAADTLWSTIRVGTTVLAFEFTDPEIFGWSAAIVVSISKDGTIGTLRWRDWPAKTFQSSIQSLALLRPDLGS